MRKVLKGLLLWFVTMEIENALELTKNQMAVFTALLTEGEANAPTIANKIGTRIRHDMHSGN